MYLLEKVEGENISYYIEKGHIHILNDEKLNKLLKEKSAASVHVARMVLEKYENQYGKFNASVGSVALEILGHVYPDRIAKKLLQFNLMGIAKENLNKILAHTDVIDIGESDIERWTLNQLGKFVDLFFK